MLKTTQQNRDYFKQQLSWPAFITVTRNVTFGGKVPWY
jgi:hypothetical protein